VNALIQLGLFQYASVSTASFLIPELPLAPLSKRYPAESKLFA
jgi:hypothetical protein